MCPGSFLGCELRQWTPYSKREPVSIKTKRWKLKIELKKTFQHQLLVSTGAHRSKQTFIYMCVHVRAHTHSRISCKHHLHLFSWGPRHSHRPGIYRKLHSNPHWPQLFCGSRSLPHYSALANVLHRINHHRRLHLKLVWNGSCNTRQGEIFSQLGISGGNLTLLNDRRLSRKTELSCVWTKEIALSLGRHKEPLAQGIPNTIVSLKSILWKPWFEGFHWVLTRETIFYIYVPFGTYPFIHLYDNCPWPVKRWHRLPGVQDSLTGVCVCRDTIPLLITDFSCHQKAPTTFCPRWETSREQCARARHELAHFYF